MVKLKDVALFILKVSVLILLWKPLAILTIALVVIGLAQLFIGGPFCHYPDPVKDISILRKGDIILTGNDSVFSAFYIQGASVLTRKLKHRFWTHAAIYQGGGKLIEAQPKGIIERDIQDYLKDNALIRAFRHKYIKDEAIIDQILAKCKEKEGRPYGWIGLGFFTLSSFIPVTMNFLFENVIIDKWCKFDNKYFCSELIIDSFEEVGYPVSPFDGWRVKPSDFISNPLLEPIHP